MDVDSDLMVSAVIYQADDPDGDTILATVTSSWEQLEAVGADHAVEEVLEGATLIGVGPTQPTVITRLHPEFEADFALAVRSRFQ